VADSTKGVISMATCDVTAEARIARPIAAGGLMALMAVGSVAMWTVIPIAGLWVASRLSDSYTQMGVAPLLAAAVGIPVAMAVAAKLLARVERLHMRITGTAPPSRVVPARRRSLGDSRPERLTTLDRILVLSVLVAMVAMAVWFFAFAGSSLPA
jgi:hypothetical protein